MSFITPVNGRLVVQIKADEKESGRVAPLVLHVKGTPTVPNTALPLIWTALQTNIAPVLAGGDIVGVSYAPKECYRIYKSGDLNEANDHLMASMMLRDATRSVVGRISLPFVSASMGPNDFVTAIDGLNTDLLALGFTSVQVQPGVDVAYNDLTGFKLVKLGGN